MDMDMYLNILAFFINHTGHTVYESSYSEQFIRRRIDNGAVRPGYNRANDNGDRGERTVGNDDNTFVAGLQFESEFKR
jgi:hypothetical protein